MSTKNIKTIKQLVAKVNSGKLDGSKLHIDIDNDATYFSYGQDDEGYSITMNSLQGNGEMDVFELYEILFPKAKVNRV